MQDIFGSVRRSLVFRATSDNEESPSPIGEEQSTLVEKINSCIRKSRVFSKLSLSPQKSSKPSVEQGNALQIRWRKGELIGCGSFGRVYMGMNLDSGELIAIKQVLLAENSASTEKAQAHIKELEDEVKILKKLSHPNIVRYLGTVREEETINILMEFVPGGSISSLLSKFGSFPETVIRAYTKQLLFGLDHLHRNGIMHRDIKGANILVDNKGCIKLADFGASKQVAELATISGAKSMKGTPYWMAPEVILQTGHSFSADIWSVGCTVIEMTTGKPPWSQQYQEVAALFHIGTTKSHPPIPEQLSNDAKDFLLKCLQKEPNLRPAASELLQHPFIERENTESHPISRFPTMDNPETPFSSYSKCLETFEMSTRPDDDICNLGSMQFSTTFGEKSLGGGCDWKNNNDADMVQIDRDDTATNIGNISSSMVSDKFKSFNPVIEPSDDWDIKLEGTLEAENNVCSETYQEGKSDFSFPCTTSLSEDDDELTESKIRAFLDEKALDLKKLQTPLYEEFYNSMNAACSPIYMESTCDETSPRYLKLPPKNRSPSRGPIGTSVAEGLSTGSPGSNGRCVSNVHNTADQISHDTRAPPCGLPVDGQQDPSSPSYSLSFSERQRRWKEELDQELERKREIMRQAGVGGKTLSPHDRATNRQRDRTTFASPSR